MWALSPLRQHDTKSGGGRGVHVKNINFTSIDIFVVKIGQSHTKSISKKSINQPV